MNLSHLSKSPIKDHDDTRLTLKQKKSTNKHKLKSKSQINIRNKHTLNELNNQLTELKLKINKSKGILTTIYTKAKRKQSHYQNQLSKKELNLHRANKLTTDYKKLYTEGLKLVESCVQKNHNQNLKRNQKLLNPHKLLQLKKNALQKIQQKRRIQSQIQKDIKTKDELNNIPEQLSLNKEFSKDLSQQNITQRQRISTKNKKDTNPINKMQKSSSAINTRKKYPASDKVTEKNSKKNKSTTQIKIQNPNTLQKIKPKTKYQQQKIIQAQNSAIIQQKTQTYPTQSKNYIKQSKLQVYKGNQKKNLYEIYKQRIQKRQKQLNSQKMSWIVDKLKENIDDLQLIRKKSQIKLKRISKSKQKINNSQNKQKRNTCQNKKAKELEIKRKSSKQRYLQIQKSKLKSINQSLM